MAKFRRRSRSRNASSGFSRTRRRFGGGNAGMGGVLKLVATGALYGALRPKAAELIAPLTSRFPMGGYSDEIVLGTAGYGLTRMRNPTLKTLGTAMILIEATAAGSMLAGNMGQAQQVTAPTPSGMTVI